MTVDVRQAIESDRPAVAAYVARIYGEYAPYKDAERFDWQYVRNPYAKQFDGLPLWLAMDGETIIGQLGVQPGQVCIKGQMYPAGWMVDLIVDPAYRGQSLGQRLYSQAATSAPFLLALTMAPAFRRMGEKLGCVTLAPLAQFVRPARMSGDAVRRYIEHRTRHHRRARAAARFATRVLQAHHVLSMAANPVLAVRDWSRRSRSDAAAGEIAEVERFGEEADALWAAVGGEHGAGVPRDAQYLNWRYTNCPHLHYRCFVLRRDGCVRGIMVLRTALSVELPAGHIVEVVASRSDSDTLDALVQYAVEHFGKSVAVVQCVSSMPELHMSLKRAGFRARAMMHPTCVCGGEAAKAACESVRDGWLFSAGDHDLDQVWAVA